MSDSKLLRQLSGETSLSLAELGDHGPILKLLETVYRAQLSEEFQSRNEAPGYEPASRLLLRVSDRLVGHLCLTSRVGCFGGQRVPLARFEDLAVYAEYEDSAAEEALLEQAEQLAVRDGALLAVTYTTRASAYLRRGWMVLRGQGHSRVNTRGALAHLDAQQCRPGVRRPPLRVNAWRAVELQDLRSLYDAQLAGPSAWGGLIRSEATWRWLVARGTHDLIFTATPPRKRSSASPDSPPAGPVVGYAVLKDSCIVELAVHPDFASARTSLLAATCREAIDRDHQFVSVHAPAVDALHDVLVTAGGTWVADASSHGGCWMLKLLAPERWIERCFSVWQQRARDRGLPRPLACQFCGGAEQWRFLLTRRSARLEPRASQQWASVACDASFFQALLVGNVSLLDALAGQEVQTSDPEIARHIAGVFAPQMFWQSPWELLSL
jgi:hypothetical protein